MYIEEFTELFRQSMGETNSASLITTTVKWLDTDKKELKTSSCFVIGANIFTYLIENKIEVEIVFSDVARKSDKGLETFVTLETFIKSLEEIKEEYVNYTVEVTARVLIDRYQEAYTLKNQRLERESDSRLVVHLEEVVERPTVLELDKLEMKESFSVDHLNCGHTIVRKFLTLEEFDDMDLLRRWSHSTIETVFIPRLYTVDEDELEDLNVQVTKDRLMSDIDKALERGDKESFLKLTRALQELNA